MGKQTWKAGNMLYPLPAVMVSVRGKNGEDNIITVAWAGTVCTNPPMVSISVRPERYSYQMIQRERCVRHQPDDGGPLLCDRLLRRALGKRCG